MKIKVAISNVKLKDTGGGVKSVQEILVNHLKKEFDVTYIGFPLNINYKKTIVPIRLDVNKSKKKGILLRLADTKISKRLIRFAFFHSRAFRNRLMNKAEIDCDVLISNSPYDFSILERNSKFHVNYKAIIFVRHDPYYNFNNFYPGRFIKDKPFKVVALNSLDYKTLSEVYGDKNTVLIPNGVDSTNSEKYDKKFIESIGIKPENKVILSLGRLEDTQKGFSFGIKAMALLKDKYPNIIYIIAGKGPDMEMYKKLISKYNLEGKVKLLGYVTYEQKYSLFRRADIILQPSEREIFSIFTLEVMHFGKPIITTKNEGSIDIIKDGYNGFFAERNEKDIADKVHKVLSLDKPKFAEIRKNSFSTAKLFSVERMIKRYKNTIKYTI
jgi:glycosyltransferase involved in cell wall biosynthesis